MWVLVTLACVVGLIVGRRGGRARGAQLRPLNKPKRGRPPILVPPGPAPPLIPSDSPKATRAESVAPVARQTPLGTPSSGGVDYIAAFSDPPKGSEDARLDYVLESDDGASYERESDDGEAQAAGSTSERRGSR